MALTFEEVDRIFKSYDLVSHTIKKGTCTEYEFKNRILGTKKRKVATRVTPLISGGIGGYIYINHLQEYNDHPQKTKMGDIPIGHMTEKELREVIEKVIVHYR